MSFLFLPALFALIPITGLLIYIYRRRGTGKRLPVPALLFLKMVQAPIRKRSSFFPPPRFFIELAILSLLTIALAAPYPNNSQGTLHVVIDNSLRLLAKNSENTLFSQEIEGKVLELSERYAHKKLKLYRAFPQLEEISGKGNDVAPCINDSSLEQQLSKLTYASADTIALVTAAPFQSTTETLTIARIGESLPNVGFVRAVEEEQGASFTIQNFSAQTQKIQLAFAEGRGEKSITQNQQREITLQPFSEQNILYPHQYPFVQATLTASGDFLVEDNSAYLNAKNGDSKIILVSQRSAKELKVTTLPFQVITPTTPLPENHGLVIYDNISLTTRPQNSALFINPSKENFFARPEKELVQKKLLALDSLHPALKYLELAEVILPKAISLTISENWSYPLLGSDFGPVAVAGEVGGYKYAAVGFELFPFEGNKNTFSSVLLLNLVHFLSSNTNQKQAQCWQPGFTEEGGSQNIFNPREQDLQDREPRLLSLPAAEVQSAEDRSWQKWILMLAALILALDLGFSLVRRKR